MTIPLCDFIAIPHPPTMFGNVLANVARPSEEWLHALGQSVDAVELYTEQQRLEQRRHELSIAQWFPRQSSTIASKAIGHVLKRHRVVQLFCPRAVQQYVEALKPRRSRRLSCALDTKLHWVCKQQRKIDIRRQGLRTQQLRTLLSFSLAGHGPSHDPMLSLNWLHTSILAYEKCNLAISIPMATVMNLRFMTAVPHLLRTPEERVLTCLTRRYLSPFALAIALTASKTTAGAEIFWKRQAFITNPDTSLADPDDEYRYDIIRYLHDMESITVIPSDKMIDRHLDSDWEGYHELIDFLVEMHHDFRLRAESLFLTVNIINRYLSRHECPYHKLRLVGCTALWIASKFEDLCLIPVSTLVHRCYEDDYEASSFIELETTILSALDWKLSHPTAKAWLRLLPVDASLQEDKRVKHFACLLMEITLFYREFVSFPPSSIALASLILARHLCGIPPRIWSETDECMEIVEFLDRRLSQYSDPLPRPSYTLLFRLPSSLAQKYSCISNSCAASAIVVAHRQRGCYPRQRVSPLWTLAVRLSRLKDTQHISDSL
ncbi:hypothetical protein BDZ89DRAFT_1115951 [Hymenopellis radicata]|nr:hypothetical protein BDZ89DRAFT_1115951 [Hymenopellis radicata]